MGTVAGKTGQQRVIVVAAAASQEQGKDDRQTEDKATEISVHGCAPFTGKVVLGEKEESSKM
jgi:hypothetical protein